MPFATFSFKECDHTIGNAVHYTLSRRHDVKFVGYRQPHPSVRTIQLNLETEGAANPEGVLQDGFKDLEDLCDTMLSVWRDVV